MTDMATARERDAYTILEHIRTNGTGRPSEQAVARLCHKYGIQLLVLFGSQTTGRATDRSDVDIAYLTAPRRRPDFLNVFSDLAPALGYGNLDLAWLNKCGPFLRWNVARDGLLLFGKSEAAWAQFRDHAFKEWQDVRRFSRYRLRSLDRSLADWGVQ
jgi:predicted nucleotidyltransferase